LEGDVAGCAAKGMVRLKSEGRSKEYVPRVVVVVVWRAFGIFVAEEA
jgi:hypothetical protein